MDRSHRGRPRAPALTLHVTLDDEEFAAGDCFYVDASLRDSEGGYSSPDGYRFTFASDDLSTPTPADGGIELYDDYCDRGTPITGVYQPNDDWGWDVWARSTRRGLFTLTASIEEADLVATTEPFRIVGGWVRGVVADAEGQPVVGAHVYRAWESAGGEDGFPQFAPIPGGGGGYGGCGVWPDRRGPAWTTYPEIYAPFLGPRIATTDADGSFRSHSIEPGGHTVYVVPPATSGLAATWLGNVGSPEATYAIELADGEELALPDVVLPPGGRIGGNVTGGDGPLEDVMVTVVDPATGIELAGERTNAEGTFETAGLRPGSYQLHFQPSSTHLSGWLGGSRTRAGSDLVQVSSGVLSDLEVSLARGSTFVVQPRDPATGAPIDGRITAYDAASGAAAAGSYWYDGAEDDEVVSSPGLPAGDYKIRVDSWDGDPPTWIGGAESFEEAEVVAIGSGEHVEMIADVPAGGVFTGVVQATTPLLLGLALPAEPASHTSVRVWDDRTDLLAAVGCTDSDGRYRTGGLGSGSYRVQFVPSGDFAPTWLGGPDRASASVIEVARGETHVANALVEPGASLSVDVRAPDGSPVPNATISLFMDGEPGDSRYAGDEGEGIVFRGLAPGSYHLRGATYSYFVDGPVLPTTWWPAAASRRASEAISVVGDEDLAIDLEFSPSAEVSGVVHGLTRFDRYADLEFLDPVSGEWIADAWTQRDGSFRLGRLHPGEYLVRMTGTFDRAPVYLGGTRSRIGATVITLEPGPNDPLSLAASPGTRIGGAVFAAHSGAHVPGVGLLVYDAVTGEFITGEQGGYEGTYDTIPLLPGAYKVLFAPQDVYAEQWFDRVSSMAEATPVVLDGGADVAGIDALLEFA